MKTKKNYLVVLALAGLVSALFSSCDIPLALGPRLDVEGPVVEFTAPVPRKAVGIEFSLEGTARDFTGVDRMLVKATVNNVEFAKQWRYTGSRWEVSEDSGASWQNCIGAEWIGSAQSAIWKIPVDMTIGGVSPNDGEYMFSIQAWDKGDFSDDNSYKTRVLIFDKNPPWVEVINPYLYGRTRDAITGEFADEELQEFHEMLDDRNEWKDPAMIGKFLTQEFTMQWQIEDEHDIWSIDIRFYKDDALGLDDNAETALPDNTYIYRYSENVVPIPPEPRPNDNIKPNGTVQVPDLAGGAGIYNNGELRNPITVKTTIRVVASCYDAAGHPNHEKTLGYFIFWPKADYPWIVYPDGLEETYTNIEDAYMVYPGRKIKATAFHHMGVGHVEYSVYGYDEVNGLGDIKDQGRLDNPPRFNGALSTSFPWEFDPPHSSGFFKVVAQAFDVRGKASEVTSAVFKVQDISFPDFPKSPNPLASDPLFKHINNGNITISGIVTDATAVKSVCMVWINPESQSYAAMAQLSYFRDSGYEGWTDISSYPEGTSREEGYFDPEHKNRLWKLSLTPDGEDYETGRQKYNYSQTINLDTQLNIATNKQALKSQMFLLRAENTDGKCTIITYAPQGDTSPPVVIINRVIVSRGTNETICIPREFNLIPIFENGDVITVEGSWREDSTGSLPIQDYLIPNLSLTVNGYALTGLTGTSTTKTVSPSTGNAVEGTFTFTGVVGGTGSPLRAESLKDAIVVAAHLVDIGRNSSEVGASWLIESDALQFVRISASNPDSTYKTGGMIQIFLEFNKPVRLKNSGSPVLTLNAGTGALATYAEAQGTDTRQYFNYPISDGHNTARLNVTGIQGGDTNWNDQNYPLTFVHSAQGGGMEEIRITSIVRTPAFGAEYTTRVLPVNDNSNVLQNPDYIYTLHAGKFITIDTSPPVVTEITATPEGWLSVGAEISITATFNKPVAIGSEGNIPYLTLGTGQTTGTLNRTETGSVRVSGNTITFLYRVKSGDNTTGNPLRVTGHGGSITDIPGTALIGTGISGADIDIRTLNGVILDTIAPAPPTVNIIRQPTTTVGTSGGTGVNPWNPSNYINSAAFNATASVTANSVNRLLNQYWDNMSIEISPSSATGDQNRWEIEYSIDYGKSWNTLQAAGGTVSVPTNGPYDVTARQKDRAGNVSQWSRPVTFVWDKGSLVTRIDSTNANGTYTNNGIATGANSRQDVIDITVYFRKPLRFSSTPSITLNVTPATVTVNANGYTNNTLVSFLNFRYSVGANHNTPTGTRLAVNTFTGGFTTAQDSDNTNVDAAHITQPSSSRLQDNKDIRIQTGNLTNITPTFDDTALSSGISRGVQTDGSYNTALVINFNREIYKGTGNITIIQSNTNYRLPAVLTEAQSNRFRAIDNFGTYYTRGTNGYNYTSATDRGADTSTKFVLDYTIDTAGTYTAPVTTMAGLFRTAEQVELSVNSQAVKIDGTRLIVELSGSNALQVPGASYLVTYSGGFVQDALNYQCTAVSQSLTLGGVAKPFVRINKRQDTLNTQTGTANNPRLTATQPFQANVRMDCRTPGSTIYYFVNDTAVTTTNGVNWSTGGGPNDTNNPAAPARPSDPQTTTTGRQTYTASNPLTIGNTSIDGGYQGLQWYVRAKAGTGGATPTQWSTDSEEMAFRTVITYTFGNGLPNPGGGEQNPGNGDQIWIRGGDAIGTSSVPGYPLTWQDDWTGLQTEKKRAGIRLMTKTSDGTIISGVWKWVSWEINTTAYVDFILGRDVDSTASEAWQYGPRQWAYQRSGWTAFKPQYPIYPGKHRWLNTNEDQANKGQTNFSGTFQYRPTNLTVSHPRPNQQ